MPKFLRQGLAAFLVAVVIIATSAADGNALAGAGMQQQQQPPSEGQDQQSANLTPQQIDNMVAPIALYPDALVAQILSGATYPTEIVEADRFVQQNKNLSQSDLMTKINAQNWDPSVKALSQFPSVLDNMSQNLTWTSSLGQAFYFQQADVMASVQRLRKEAKAAGNLKSTSQQTVVQQDPQTIIIQPANPQVVYVPTYNATVVYGTPYSPPGYSTGAMVATGLISFGVGMAVGAAINNSCCGWGWNSWGCGWHGGNVVYQRNVYVSRSNVYANGRYYGNRPVPYGSNTNFNRSGNRNTNVSGNTVNINTGNRNNVNKVNRSNNVSANNRMNTANRPTNTSGNLGANRSAASGYGQRPATGTKSGAFSGYSAGGQARAQANRGQASFGGGGARGGRRR
jgi:hypothetical protein